MQTRFMGMHAFTPKGQSTAAMHPMMLQYAEKKKSADTAGFEAGNVRPTHVQVRSTSAISS